VPFSRRSLVAAVLILLPPAVPRELGAQGTAVTTLHVGARVSRHCAVAADSPATGAAATSSVRVACARSALRALRVSIASDDGGIVIPLVETTGPQLLSGGEVTFTVPAAIVVTLDF
jgi:hypothetical protein